MLSRLREDELTKRGLLKNTQNDSLVCSADSSIRHSQDADLEQLAPPKVKQETKANQVGVAQNISFELPKK